MSLITNAISPFTKTTPLATFVLVLVLFAVFRLSSGSLYIAAEPGSRNQTPGAATSPPTAAPVQQRGREAAQHNEDILRTLLSQRERDKEQVKLPAQPKNDEKQPGGGLDDIESALGLR